MTNSNIFITIQDWIHLVEKQGTFPVNTVMEIGSMDGEDAVILQEYFKPDRVIIIEAHPDKAKSIANAGFDYVEVYNFAAAEFNGETTFNAVSSDSHLQGVSSMLMREDSFHAHETEFVIVTVPAMRMDTFCEHKGITSIDMLKLDVEGNSYEVLEGFGDMIWNIKCIHVECEHIPVWKDQKLYPDVEKLLIDRGFIPISIRIGFPQSDSVWVKKEFYNGNWFNI